MEYYYNNTAAYYPNDAYYDTRIEPEEEEEWDRESYLDPMWEIQQKKVCTLIGRLINSRHLPHGATLICAKQMQALPTLRMTFVMD